MKKKTYYWVLCILCMVIIISGSGMLLNSFSTFSPFFVSQRDFTNTQMSALMTIRSASTVFALGIANKYYEKFNLKRGMFIGIIACALSMFCYAMGSKYYLMIAASLLSGFGTSLSGVFPVSLLINRWFKKCLALALSICISGTGMSSIFMPKITVRLIANIGLNKTLLYYCFAMAAIGITCVLLIQNYPKDKGMVPYGQDEIEVNTIAEVTKPMVRDVKSITKTQNIMLLTGMLLQGIAASEATQLFTLHFSTYGFTPEQYATCISVWGFTLTFSKPFYGMITDRIGVYKMNYFSLFAAALGIGLCCFAYTGSYLVILAGCAIIGLAFPYNTIGISIWAKELFSASEFQAAFQKMQFMGQIGVLFFAMIPGMIADRTGEYTSTYVIVTIFMFTCAVLVQAVFIAHNKSEKERLEKEAAAQ